MEVDTRLLDNALIEQKNMVCGLIDSATCYTDLVHAKQVIHVVHCVWNELRYGYKTSEMFDRVSNKARSLSAEAWNNKPAGFRKEMKNLETLF